MTATLVTPLNAVHVYVYLSEIKDITHAEQLTDGDWAVSVTVHGRVKLDLNVT